MRDEAYDHVDPYADGTYGTNYTPASTELERDKHAEFSRQQTVVLGLAAGSRGGGITGADVKQYFQWETNAVSRTLSNLLRDGQLVRLKERRGRAHVHVLPQWRDGREVLPYVSTASKTRLATLHQARRIMVTSYSLREAMDRVDELIAAAEES
jgi:hypothetical protein